MAILVDFSQLAMAGIMQFQHDLKNGSDDKIVNLIRHVVLNSLQHNKKKFQAVYGDIVICADGRNYWRKGPFPQYKANRAKNRDASDINWKLVFDTLSKIRDELRDNFPYRVVCVEGAEADDVIGVLTEFYQEEELKTTGLVEEPQPILILTSDQDNFQLHKHKNVKQFSPMHKKFVKPEYGASKALIDKICMGDTGDGIPNIMSPDDVFVSGGRQKPFKKARLEDFYARGIDACANDTERRNFQRNELLVSYDKIPADLQTQIINTYKAQTPVRSPKKIMDYLVANKCRNLLDNIEDF
jgi:hypothetical protein